MIDIRGRTTSINGIVNSRDNEQTWSLENANLVLMIKDDLNHNIIHHFKLNVTQSIFPIHFQLTDLHEIQHTNEYLVSLLIFAYPHRLLWESTLARQRLTANRTNSINFVVGDVCE